MQIQVQVIPTIIIALYRVIRNNTAEKTISM